MPIVQDREHTWTKSSYSGGNGACVEVMSPGRGSLAVRDSKHPRGPRLGFTAASWTTFLGFLGSVPDRP